MRHRNVSSPVKILQIPSLSWAFTCRLTTKPQSNTTEPLVASIKGVRYVVPISLKVGLYNHSATDTQSYMSGTAVSATWRMRIRRDNPF